MKNDIEKVEFDTFKNKEKSENKVRNRKEIKKRLNYGNLFKLILLILVISSLINSVVYMFTPKIGVVPIYGVITTTGGNSFYSNSVNAKEIASRIRDLKDDSSVKAILIDINSPGGSPVGSEMIAKSILEVSKYKPVYSVVEDIGASGGYWIAIASNKTYASDMSLVGSIGVTSASFGLENFIKRYNITYRRLVAGKYKDFDTPFRSMTPDEKSMLKGILNDLHTRFKVYVSKRRNISLNKLAPYAEGQVFLGDKAKQIGLIDGIGTYNDVLNMLKKRVNETGLIVVEYQSKKTLSEILGLNQIFKSPNFIAPYKVNI